MKIGIIGAENSHTAAIAKIINIDKKIKGFSVDYVWGETAEHARNAAREGHIPNIVKYPNKMLGNIDAIIVDHRHPRFHLKAVLPFVKAGIPTYVDKPFCYRVAEGKRFLKVAAESQALVTSFSVLPKQQSFKRFVSKCSTIGNIISGTTYGPCDLNSPWGGIFFYGIHQVDMALKAFGYNVNRVLLTKNKGGSTGQLLYDDGKTITMNLINEGCSGFGITAVGAENVLHRQITFDKNMYLSGVRNFTKMFRTRNEPETYQHLLKPVSVLEAMQVSGKSGKVELVKNI